MKTASPERACLWCAKPLPTSTDHTLRCAHCGRNNRRDDLATYRTLRPEARRLQTAIEVICALVLAGCFFAAVVNWRHLKGGDAAVHWRILGPAILALGVGYQSRFLTRRHVKRRWSISPLSCGGLLLAFAAYWIVLGYSVVDLEGTPLYVTLAVAVAVVAAMGYRVWRASTSHT